jgi:cytochrome P450
VRQVVTEVFRAPNEQTELGGYLFEPGMQLAASILLVQLDPELYPPDPEVFRPERFLEGAPSSYAWIPFGGGVRRCLGAAFAQLEMKIVISTIAARARLRAPRAKAERARFRGVTVLPSRGGEAIVELVSRPAGAAGRNARRSPRSLQSRPAVPASARTRRTRLPRWSVPRKQ